MKNTKDVIIISSFLYNNNCPVDSEYWKLLLNKYDSFKFIDGESEVEMGTINKNDDSFIYEFKQGGMFKKILGSSD
jgi:hypothetical protein